MRAHFLLDPDVCFLNHGSFGACPRAVLDAQTRLRERMERQPVLFLARELEGLLDEARATLAAFVGAAPEDLAFVSNATTGVNAVLRSLALAPGDELLTTDHAYNACGNALDYVARRAGARVVVAPVPFPLESDEQVISAVTGAATERTRLALIDHVTSPTGLVFPVRAVVEALQGRGIDVLVDGAHAPGMLPLALGEVGAAYYTGNCHKWLCAPKGAGFLVVRRDRQEGLVPTVVSHGWNAPAGRSRFHLLFDWLGTVDPTPWLCIPEAIRTIGALLPGGWPEVMARNHALALQARALLVDRCGLVPAAPEANLGTLVAFELAAGDPVTLQAELLAQHGIEIPVYRWNGRRLIRLSAAIHTELRDVQRLAAALPSAIARAG